MATGVHTVDSDENSVWSYRTVADHAWTHLSLQSGQQTSFGGSQFCTEGCSEFVKSLQEESHPEDKLQSSPCFSPVWSEFGTAPLLLVTGV